MGIPDQIERVVELAHPPEKVWEALTTAEGLAAWFGDEATIDLRPGGAGRLVWTAGHSADLRIERVEEPVVFAYTWRIADVPEHDPARTLVEFTLEPTESGTRLRVVESGFAQVPEPTGREVFDDHTEGWGRELGELADHLNAA